MDIKACCDCPRLEECFEIANKNIDHLTFYRIQKLLFLGEDCFEEETSKE